MKHAVEMVSCGMTLAKFYEDQCRRSSNIKG
jgi:hypothetical protein